MRIVRLTEDTKKEALEALIGRSPSGYEEQEKAVREIIEEIRTRGDEALFAYEKKFDRCDLTKDTIRVSREEIEEVIGNAAKDLNCDVKIKTSMMDMSMLYGSGVTIQVRGRDLSVLQDLAREVGAKLEGVEGLENVNDGLRNMEKEVYISVDKEKAAKYGMTVAQVFQPVSTR